MLDLPGMRTIMRANLKLANLPNKEVIMRSTKNFFTPADPVNIHIPET